MIRGPLDTTAAVNERRGALANALQTIELCARPIGMTLHNIEEPVNAMQAEVLKGLENDVAKNLLLLPIDEAWQPSDYLPDLAADDWMERLQQFRQPAQQLDDELLVVLVADMITEEALPSYGALRIGSAVQPENLDLEAAIAPIADPRPKDRQADLLVICVDQG